MPSPNLNPILGHHLPGSGLHLCPLMLSPARSRKCRWQAPVGSSEPPLVLFHTASGHGRDSSHSLRICSATNLPLQGEALITIFGPQFPRPYAVTGNEVSTTRHRGQAPSLWPLYSGRLTHQLHLAQRIGLSQALPCTDMAVRSQFAHL